MLFFFSSRRRHTRCSRDWSSDVCSSDLAGMSVRALVLPHGDRSVLGYRVGPIAYLTDAKAIPEAALARLAGLEVLVLNALLPRPHPLHLSIPEAVAAAQQIGARRTFLTHLTPPTRRCDASRARPRATAPPWTSWCARRCLARRTSGSRRVG